MRYTIAGEHQKFFQTYGYIEFEDMVPIEEVEQLQKEIEKIDRDENFSRSIPFISALIRRRQLDEIAQLLSGKKKLELIHDARILMTLKDDECGLLLFPQGNVLYFKGELYKDLDGWYFLLVFGEKQ